MNPKQGLDESGKVEKEGLSIIDTPQKPCEMDCDPLIAWPPRVVVRYLENDEKDDIIKYIVIRGQRFPDVNALTPGSKPYGPHGLLACFSEFKAVFARHCHDRTGTSLLEFEDSAMGYVEAERLHKHFADQGAGRDAWDRRVLLVDGTLPHKFFGYMANKEDMEIFNQHCRGIVVKFEMRSLHEMTSQPSTEQD